MGHQEELQAVDQEYLYALNSLERFLLLLFGR